MTKGESTDDELPVITGHAGSIRCVCILEKQGIVLSGSYDTSIRWVKLFASAMYPFGYVKLRQS